MGYGTILGGGAAAAILFLAAFCQILFLLQRISLTLAAAAGMAIAVPLVVKAVAQSLVAVLRRE
jgi:hypothetical protein